jgi:hypothetical protein
VALTSTHYRQRPKSSKASYQQAYLNTKYNSTKQQTPKRKKENNNNQDHIATQHTTKQTTINQLLQHSTTTIHYATIYNPNPKHYLYTTIQ